MFLRYYTSIYLKGLEKLGFESDSIKSLTDEGGKCISQPNIFAGLRWLFDGAGSDDLLVLFSELTWLF